MPTNLSHALISSWAARAIGLLLALAVTIGDSPAIWAQRFVPGDRGLPGRRQGGGTRGGCVQNQFAFTALMPETNLGLTTKANPTLLWYVPTTEATAAEFVLLDENNAEVYQSLVQLTGAGVVSLSLPAEAGLQVGKTYQWYFSVICDAEDRSGDVTTEGWIQRIAPAAELTSRLTTAAEGDRPTLYAEAGIWYDALSTLAELRRANPDDRTLVAQWHTLLASVGLEGLSEQPLIACCQSIALQPSAISPEPAAPLTRQ